jgi:DNA-binding SARP family transcriptional activator
MAVTEAEFCLLGPFAVRVGGAAVPVQKGKQRALLAALLLSPGRVVSLDYLAETLWGPDPPPSARVTIQNYVMRLRKALGAAGTTRITTLPAGYAIYTEPGELDVTRFEDLLSTATAAAREDRWQDAAERAHAAVALWRGDPLADVGSGLLAEREVPRLAEMRLRALETRNEADLHLGRHADVITGLQRLTACHPLRERLHAQLMLALYRDGRQAEALAVYQRARQVLVTELGTEPGPGLRKLHQQVLASDPALALRRAAAAGNGAAGETPPALSWPPRELPAGVPHFTGRAGLLAALTEVLDRSCAQCPGTVVISAISGTAGVGKTALAVHWAHQVADRFPDGQLYVNLRGYDPSGAPLAPAEAVRGFLDALGVAASRVPAGLQAQAGLYRSLMAGKRMLILLDNARDAAQVRPLLPGSAGCLVLVTSRSQLTGLAAADGARLLTVDVLTDPEASTLLSRRLGAGRVAAEPAAAAELTALCARLPLALNIAAARAGARPDRPLAAVAAALRDERSRLDAFDTGEPASSARTVFFWSYRHLSEPAARMFRLLGLHPGPDITPAAASLAGIPAGQASRCLDELTATHLAAEQAPGRFSFHDLLRAYAREQAGSCDSAPARQAALGRMLDHYLHTARAAAGLLCPGRDLLALSPPGDGVQPEPPASSAAALAWFIAERQVVSAAVRLAADAGLDRQAWQLGWILGRYLHRSGYWQGWLAVLRTALAAAEHAADLAGQAHVHRDLGGALICLGSGPDADDHLKTALRLYQGLDDQAGQAHALLYLARVREEGQGRPRAGLRYAFRALELFLAAGHKAGQANAISNAGWCHSVLGEHEEALACYQQALALHREIDNRDGECYTRSCLGNTYHRLGRHDQAVTCFQESARLFRELGNHPELAAALTHLGDSLHAAGHPGDAHAAWQEAHQILAGLHDPSASQILARLSRLRAA